MHYRMPIYIVRWRHNIREIAVETCENSKNRRKRLCAQLCVDSRQILVKFHRSTFATRT